MRAVEGENARFLGYDDDSHMCACSAVYVPLHDDVHFDHRSLALAQAISPF